MNRRRFSATTATKAERPPGYAASVDGKRAEAGYAPGASIPISAVRKCCWMWLILPASAFVATKVDRRISATSVLSARLKYASENLCRLDRYDELQNQVFRVLVFPLEREVRNIKGQVLDRTVDLAVRIESI